jgi:hypothetical protein
LYNRSEVENAALLLALTLLISNALPTLTTPITAHVTRTARIVFRRQNCWFCIRAWMCACAYAYAFTSLLVTNGLGMTLGSMRG